MKGKDVIQYVLVKTPFYAESGGQVGDKGLLRAGESVVRVFDTKKENGEIVHFSDSLLSDLNGPVNAEVASDFRTSVTKNHTATHLLHKALRDVLGTHVEQKGSLVASDKLRFDFSHFEKIAESDYASIEASVRQQIQSSLEFEEWRNMPINEAKNMGAMALFGEKYGDSVRVVKFGDSVELCGGTHVDNSSAIGGFKLIAEGSVASGIRRIEAISGKAYDEYINGRLAKLAELETELGDPTKSLEILKRIKADLIIAEMQVSTYLDKQKSDLCHELIAELNEDLESLIVVKQIDQLDGKVLKEVAHRVIEENDGAIVILGGGENGKVSVVVGIGKSRLKELDTDANKVIKIVSAEIEGGGGGQPFLAMAGGKNKKGLKRALEKSVELLKTRPSVHLLVTRYYPLFWHKLDLYTFLRKTAQDEVRKIR